jgi:hypothetical protein
VQDDDDDLLLINPKLSTTKRVPPAGGRSSRTSFIGTKTSAKATNSAIVSSTSTTIAATGTGEEEEVLYVYHTNSTTNFVPIHWCFSWKDKQLRQYLTMVLPVVSGISYDGHLDGRLLPTVSTPDGMSLLIDCEWPECSVDSTLLYKTVNHNRDRNGRTMGSMLQCYDEQLRRIKKTIGVKDEAIGCTAKLDLPYAVESIIHGMYPTECPQTGGVVLFIELKKRVTDAESEPKPSLKLIGHGSKRTYGTYKNSGLDSPDNYGFNK